jgi:excisionase family DNA binding protein
MKTDTTQIANDDGRDGYLYTRRQAAAWLCVSERYLSQLTREGRIRAVRFGKKAVRYALSDLNEFAASCRI